jgi:predicted dehydrogenase
MKALVIGYGSIGKRHIKNLASIKNMKIVVNTKRNKNKFLKDTKCTVYQSLELCIKEKPDFAIICNETVYHVDISIKLAKAGIHIFIEKPISNSLKNIKKLLNISDKNKIITHVGSVLHFHPCIKKIKEIIEKKELGRILSVNVENGSYLPDWHPGEDYRKSYSAKKELGGGVILTCIHEIDYLCWFFDKIIETVSYTKKVSDLDLSVDDLSSILFLFKNDIIGQVHLDYFQAPNSRTCKIIGTKGTLVCDLESNFVKIFNIKSRKWKTKLKLGKKDTNQMYKNELIYFIKCIKNNLKDYNDIKQGAYVLKIALSVKKSAVLRKKVKIIE